ncbi:MAG: serine O-acetyltransferase [Chloroflexi bacterium]|nr:serine O-acetyltransferase [Chloroflexota bacterium]
MGLLQSIRNDIQAAKERDPAATSTLEIIFAYPGFHARQLHRLAHTLHTRGLRLPARLISHLGRALTGIEIHPCAQIGEKFFIDHGMGVVIGETSQIGDGVTLYHDVTLGGVAPSVDSHNQRNTKRHPTLEDGVIVGSGAQVLGPITVGRDARIGANAVVTKDVPAGATMVGVPARAVQPREPQNRDQPRFVAYGTPTGDLPDPVARAIDGLLTMGLGQRKCRPGEVCSSSLPNTLTMPISPVLT